jgi:hypothetical protein
MRIVLASAVAGSILGLGASAYAQQCTGQLGAPLTADEARACDATRVDAARRGVEADVRLGLGGHIDSSSTAFSDRPRANDSLFWPGFALQTTVGYRFTPWISAGAHFGYQNNQARDLPQGTTAGDVNTFAVGVYGRFYLGGLLRWRYFDPSFSVGVDPYAAVFVRHDTPIGGVSSEITTVAIPMSLNLDFYPVRALAVGLQTQISPWVPWRRCDSNPRTGTTCTGADLETNVYFFAGLGVRYTFGR